MTDCLVCLEKIEYLVVGECNHPILCLLCAYKMRSKNNDKNCIYCKAENKSVVIFKDLKERFHRKYLKPEKLFSEGIYWSDQETRQACQKMMIIDCPLEDCYSQEKSFETSMDYKRHLKDVHHKYICEVCFKDGVVMLNDLKLYSKIELDKHISEGVRDKNNNIILKHPFCKFCQEYFYNDDIFLTHMRTVHYHCHLCTDKKFKYFYYKNSNTLEIHYQLSHFACSYESCKLNMIVFKNMLTLEKHLKRVHREEEFLNKRINLGFSQGKTEGRHYDKEGLNVERELFQIKQGLMRERTKADYEDFIKELVTYDLMYFLVGNKERNNDDEVKLIEEYYQSKQRNKGQNKKQETFLEDVAFIIEDRILGYEEFNSRISSILQQSSMNYLNQAIASFYQKYLKVDQLFRTFKESFGKKLSYKYFHLFIKTVRQYQQSKKLQRHFD